MEGGRVFNADKVKLGIAPIGWCNDDLPDLGAENTFEQTISEMALAGFQGCETGNRFPRDGALLKHKLDVRGLTVCNAWFSSMLTAAPYAETIEAFIRQLEFLHALGAPIIGVSEQGNSIQGRQDLAIFGTKVEYTEQQWAMVVRGFNEMGALAREKGMCLAVHHHMGTGVQTGAEIDRLMASTDPDLVFLLFDTGHLAFAGENPSAVLEKHFRRIRHVHLKDIRFDVFHTVKSSGMSFLDAVRAGVFTVPGDGDIDFRPILDTLSDFGYEGWLVVEAEQDPSRANPFEYAQKARRYIKTVTGL
jgi:inosose dehydratase